MPADLSIDGGLTWNQKTPKYQPAHPFVLGEPKPMTDRKEGLMVGVMHSSPDDFKKLVADVATSGFGCFDPTEYKMLDPWAVLPFILPRVSIQKSNLTR